MAIFASQDAWSADLEIDLPPSGTVRQALDLLKAHGLRWGLHEGAVCVVR